MVLGLILMILGALAIIAAIGTADGAVELLGVDTSALALFLIGVGSGLAVWWGFGLTRWGTRRTLRQRRESRRLGELSDKLDQREAERHGDDRDPGTDR
jgi:hypothetical protein